MTLGQAVRRVMKSAPRDSTGLLQNDVLMVRDWIAARYRRGLDRWTWSVLQVTPAPITTLVGIDVYALPANWGSDIDFINLTTPNPIYRKPPEYLDRLDPGRLQLAPPRFYTILSGNSVKFYPIPDNVYQVNYRYNSTGADVVLSSDVFLLHNIEFVITGALSDAYKYLAGIRNVPALQQQATGFEQQFETQLQDAIRFDLPNVILPQHPEEAGESEVWFSADDIRSHDMGFAPI